MSSHREAPAISKDPVADNTDTYAFVSPDNPSTVTIIANYLPLEAPFGGPNFFEFGQDVRYRINVDNDGTRVICGTPRSSSIKMIAPPFGCGRTRSTLCTRAHMVAV